ncbi:peptide MFS transporter [Macrococcus equipercicus]|uniref:Oligopeptide:H+ symporter n=1 Tax=Macrococcus equipercicus TaxID=69967 RepID=A0A9Q9BUG0_9STAP|nr:oligopeptide:H+ symporter [Macrococcus equipercicus]UTH14316.1 oligopeptide:H+ symporter [Macrococcus equipercicus]
MSARHTREEVVNSMPRTGFFGHPRGLITLMLTEFWERFSYYGMKAILVFYLYYSVAKGGFGIEEGFALQIVSIYGALIYMSGIIGGWIADRLLGTRHSITIGAVLIMIGHILLSLPNNFTLMLVALLFIILGTGLLKPNISSTVGELYHKNDSRVDAAFTLFVMSINLGAFLAPLVVGSLQMNIGFHAGFAAAAIGMFFSLIAFVIMSKRSLGLAGLDVPNPITPEERKKTITYLLVIVLVFALYFVYLAWRGQLDLPHFANMITFLGVVLPVIYFTLMIISPKTSSVEKSRVTAYIPLFLAAVVFWMIQEQGSTVLANFSDKKTQLDLNVLTNGAIDFRIPAAWFQSLNPLFIVTLAPLFSILWTKLGKRNPSTVVKFAIALILAGLSFMIMIMPLQSGVQLINPLWLVLSFLLVTLAELCLSPTGLSTTTKLAPEAFTAQMMSIWFLSNTMAQGLNAQLVNVYTSVSPVRYFGIFGGIAIGLGIILFFVSPFIKKLMHGIH